MTNPVKNLIIKYLNKSIDEINDGQCEYTEEELFTILSTFAHKPLSKEQACNLLNISRSTFDAKVAKGELPKGRKRSGFKELVWFLDDLELSRL